MNVEMASQIDEILLDEILNDEKYNYLSIKLDFLLSLRLYFLNDKTQSLYPP